MAVLLHFNSNLCLQVALLVANVLSAVVDNEREMALCRKLSFLFVANLFFTNVCAGNTDYTVSVNSGVARRFDGIGAISGGGVSNAGR